jgi:ubiquinol-cytochrome c reductase cytochrome b subunit
MTDVDARPTGASPAEPPARPERRERLLRVLLPVHWSFLISQVALWSLVILLVTGVYLAVFYRPGAEAVLYDGSAELYAGTELPRAFATTLGLSEDVVIGEVARRLHRVATYTLIASLLAHMLRVVLTGAFRSPRRANHLLGALLLLLAIGLGYTGHLLPFDMVAGASLQIAWALVSSLPLLGERLAPLLFGAEAAEVGWVLTPVWILHVFVLPPLLVAGIALHLAAVARQGHARLPQHVRRRSVPVRDPVGRFWLLGLLTTGILLASSALVPWAGIDLAGPFRPGEALNDLETDWYVGWAQGALRIVPGIDVAIGPVVLTNAFVGGVVLPGLIVTLALVYPWLEPLWRRGRVREPDVLQHPFADPVRVGLVTAWIAVVAVLLVAAADHLIALYMGVPVASVVVVLRVAVVVAPVLAGVLAWWYARREGPRWRSSRAEPARTGERIDDAVREEV